MDRFRGRNALRLTLATVILVGFAVRVWQIGAQSLWFDETVSVVFARPSLPEVFTNLVTQDIHPPLYYVLVHFWLRLAGASEFAVRYLSLVLGLPAIPATYVLGASLFRSATSSESPKTVDRGQTVGLIGCLFLALSPFMVEYSQEARMYSALATFGVLSSLALWKFLESGSRAWWIGYVAGTAATVYSQYFGAFVIAFQGLYLLGYAIRRRRRAVFAFAGMAATGLTYLPWLPGTYSQLQRLIDIPDFWKGDFQLSFLVEHIFAAFAIGHISAVGQLALVAVVAAVVALGGIAFLGWQALRRGGGELYALAYLIVPFIALYAVLVRDPKFTERYLIMIAPPFYLVLALGLVSVGAWIARSTKGKTRAIGFVAPGIVGLVLIGASVSQLWQVWYGPGYRKDDNRGAIAYIERHAQPGDVVVLMMNIHQAYEFYSNGSVPWAPLQPGGDVEQAANELNHIVAGHKRVWLLMWNPEWADPTNFVRQSLDHAYHHLPVDQQFTGLGLQLFEVDPSYRFTIRTTPQIADAVDFGNQVQLLGYDLAPGPIEAGKTGRITLYWKALTQLQHDYIISLRLTDGRFYWWRHDDRPAAFNYPTMYWQPGQIVTGQVEFQVPPGTPPGSYHLEVGVYGQGIGSDLDVLRGGQIPSGTAATLAPIDVTRPAQQADVTKLAVPNRQDVAYGTDLRLLGAAVQTPRVSPGSSVDVTLWWQALRTALPNYRVQLLIANGDYQKVVADEGPDAGRYETNRWVRDEVVVDRHRFVVPPDVPTGPAQIQLQLWPTGSAVPAASTLGPSISVGSTQVIDRRRLTTPPGDIQKPLDVRVGTFAHLIGDSVDSTASRPGDHVHVTVYWQALGNSGEASYTVFAHLLDQHSLVKAQQDRLPGDGDDPTSGWVEGEYVVDHYDLAIPADTAPGPYAVELGMYNAESSARLPIMDGASKVIGDRIVLATIQVR